MKSKPREFWISDGWETHGCDEWYSCVYDEAVKNSTHVIEHSAYEQAIQERDEAKAQCEELVLWIRKLAKYPLGPNAAIDIAQAVYEYEAWKGKGND